MSIKNTIKLDENEITKVVYEATKKALNEGFYYRTYPEGKPEKASDVITGNGWSARVVSKEPGKIVLKCHQNSDSWLALDDVLPFDELVEDLNIYYEDKGLPIRATGEDNDEGWFITVQRQ